MLKTEDLTHFVSVAQHNGFSAASKATGVEVTTLSRAVARLEKQLQCSLFHRTTRRVSLTPEGEQFLQEVTRSLAILNNARENLAQSKTKPSGKLRVNAANPFILHVLTPLIPAFLQRYPEIRIELSSDDNIVNLLEKKADVAFRIGALEDSTLKMQLIGRSPLFLVASPQYLAQHGAPRKPEHLGQHRFLGFQTPSTLNQLPFASNVNLEPYIAASSGETLRQLCLQGMGIAYLSRFMIQNDIEQDTLRPIMTEFTQRSNSNEPLTGREQATDRERIQAVYYNSTTGSASLPERVNAFIQFVKQHAQL